MTYSDGSTTMRGFVVYDDASNAKRPGIVIVHEWWGITRHVHGEAQRLASEGYTAFIAHMYGDGKTADNPKDAGKPDSVEQFKKEMDAAKLEYRYIDYPGAVHAFTNPEATEKGKQFNLPLAYNAAADQQSKAEMTKFFAQLFAKR